MSYSIDELRLRARRIFVRGLARNLYIGAYEEEQGRRQPVSFDIDVWVDWQYSNGKTLETVYDYTAIPKAVDEVIAVGHIELQETLVDAIADKLLCDPRVRAVQVSSCKLNAMTDTAGVGVEIFRQQTSSSSEQPS